MTQMNWEEFEALSAEEQARLFHERPLKERGDLLLHSHDPHHLTRSLSQEELYLITKEMDVDERSEIIRYANLPQLFFVSDIDCWKKDRLDPNGFLRWLETLENAAEKTLLAWLIEMDYETVVAGLKKIISVLKPEREYAVDEVLGDQSYFTLDEFYFISVQEENLETVRHAMEILYENHRGRYVALLEGVIGDIEDEIEEEAFQKRETRLAERGFPEPEIARKIYRPISPEEFENFPKKKFEKERAIGNEFLNKLRMPNYPVLWGRQPFFLDDALLALRDDPAEIQEGIHEELIWLSNKVIACQGLDFSSEEAVRRGVERSRAFVNIGLEILSGRNLETAKEFLRERWLEIIFRRASTAIFQCKKKAQEVARIYWNGSEPALLEFLNAPYDAIFQGMFRVIPECYDAEVSDAAVALRDFKNLQDVGRTEKALVQIAKIHECLNAQFPNLFRELTRAKESDSAEVTLFSVLATQFVGFVLDGNFNRRFLKESDLAEFLSRGFEIHGNSREIKTEFKEKFLAQIFPSAGRDLFRTLFALVFDQMEEELKDLKITGKFDQRFVSILCFQRSGKKK